MMRKIAWLILPWCWIGSVHSAEKSLYCSFRGFHLLNDATPRKVSWVDFGKSGKMDLSTASLKHALPDEKGNCAKPVCRTAGSFGVKDELMGSVDTCTDCGLRDFQTVLVEHRGLRIAVPMHPVSNMKLALEPSAPGALLTVEKLEYDKVMLNCSDKP